MVAETLTIVLIVVGSTSIFVNAGLAWWILTRSDLGKLHTSMELARNAAEQAMLRVDTIELRQTTWKAELDDYLGAIDDILERTEKKRRRAQSSEQRADAAHQNQQPTSILDLPRAEQVALGRRGLAGIT